MKKKKSTRLVYDITTNTSSSPYKDDETFEVPKPKDFEMTIEFNSNKPNKITYDSRDNISDDKNQMNMYKVQMSRLDK